MKRLRRQPPMKLREDTVELLKDEPELLAIADAIQATQAPRRHHLQRRTLIAAAGLLIAVLVVGIGLDVSGSDRDLIDRAAAAAGQGRLISFVAERPTPDEAVVDLSDGSERSVPVRIESWRDAVTGKARLRVTRGNAVVYDTTARRIPPDMAAFDLGLRDVEEFARRYRSSLETRRAVEKAPEGLVSGETLRWLRLPALSSNGIYVGLDPRTFRPIRLHAGGGDWVLSSYTTNEALSALNPVVPRALRDEPSSLESSKTASLAQARQWLNHGFGRIGRRTPGVGLLRDVKLQQIRVGAPASARTVRGVSLRFGSEGSPVDINVARTPTQTHGFNGGRLTFSFSSIPPPGQVALTRLTNRWVAQGHTGEVYFSVEGPSRATVIAAARALTD